MNEFTFSLQTLNFSENYKVAGNPFTGKEVKFYLNNGLSIEDYLFVRKKLDQLNATPADPEGFRYVNVNGNQAIGVGGFIEGEYKKSSGCEIELNTIDQEVMELVLDIAKNANMYFSSNTDPEKIAIHFFDEYRIPKNRFKEIYIIKTIDDLKDWIANL